MIIITIIYGWIYRVFIICWRRVWRYQRSNQNPYIEEKVQKDKQWSTKHTYKTKERVTWSLLKTGGELG
jgi:hypothetical protein